MRTFFNSEAAPMMEPMPWLVASLMRVNETLPKMM